MTARSWMGIATLVLAACGGAEVGSGNAADAGGHDAQADGPSGDDAAVDAAVDAPLDAPLDAPPDAPAYLECMRASGQVDSSLKTCQTDADCLIKQEQADCCGTILYVGVDNASASEFDACEAAWVAHFPACGCASGQTKTEDGKTTLPGMVDAGAPQVHCTDFTMSGGVCMTYTP